MRYKELKDEGDVLRIQKEQLNKGFNKAAEINQILSEIEKEQQEEDILLADMLDTMESLVDNNYLVDVSEENLNITIEQITSELDNVENNSTVNFLSEVDNIDLAEDDGWDNYLRKVKAYAIRHNINLNQDPFKHLMSKAQQIELEKRIEEEFTFKNAKCDKYDYLIAGTCGVIGGLIDVLFVGAPGKSKLGVITDKTANKITEKFAEALGWDRDKAVAEGKNTTASAIGYLERKFKVNYDQSTTVETGRLVKNLSKKNHHLKNLAHSPDLIGLFFSILSQFTNSSVFVSEGKIIKIDTQTFELQGSNFIAKICCGFANWFGHIMSDWAGSSGSVGQGHRGTGVPIPFYNLFQLMNFGSFGKERDTVARITSKVFEKGYDLRHGLTMAIPVVITELLIRFMYTMKAHFYHKKEWQDSMPSPNTPELRRMLLIGHGVLCLIDGIDAFVRSSRDMVSFLLRTNLIGWVRLGNLSLKELKSWYNQGHIDCDAVDEYLEQEYKRILAKS